MCTRKALDDSTITLGVVVVVVGSEFLCEEGVGTVYEWHSTSCVVVVCECQMDFSRFKHNF